MSAVDCAPYVFDNLLHCFLEFAYINSAYVADESSVLTLRSVIYIEDRYALSFLRVRDRQLDEVPLVTMGLFRDQVLIVVEREGLLRFNLGFQVGLHICPER